VKENLGFRFSALYDKVYTKGLLQFVFACCDANDGLCGRATYFKSGPVSKPYRAIATKLPGRFESGMRSGVMVRKLRRYNITVQQSWRTSCDRATSRLDSHVTLAQRGVRFRRNSLKRN
jgi:hypothetical protein